MPVFILCIAGPTASGKSKRAVEEALRRDGEVISVDSRQVYRGLDIGTEKTAREERGGVPHHLIDIRDARERYSAGDFVADAARLIAEISARGKLPILAGGTHFYFDALTRGLPTGTAPNSQLREELEKLPTEELFARVRALDSRRAAELDPYNRRRLIRALEIIASVGSVPPRVKVRPSQLLCRSDLHTIEWIVINPPAEELRKRIDARLGSALERGLIEEVRRVRAELAKAYGSPGVPDTLRGDARLNELGLEYRVIGEYLSSSAEATEDEARRRLLPILSAKLWQYARRQKAWLRKLNVATSSPPDRS